MGVFLHLFSLFPFLFSFIRYNQFKLNYIHPYITPQVGVESELPDELPAVPGQVAQPFPRVQEQQPKNKLPSRSTKKRLRRPSCSTGFATIPSSHVYDDNDVEAVTRNHTVEKYKQFMKQFSKKTIGESLKIDKILKYLRECSAGIFFMQEESHSILKMI